MKANKIFSLIAVLGILGMAVTSCVQDDEFAIPNGTNAVDPGLTANATFQNMVSRYQQALGDGDNIAMIATDEAEIIIEGYVISSDQAGNFFEELIIQNKTDDSDPAEDPRLGFRVDINQSALFNRYEFGRKVYIKMNGLAIGEENGVYVIGKADGNDIGQIQPFELDDFVVRGTQVVDIEPKVTSISDLTAQDENTFVKFQEVQFSLNSLGLSYAGEPSDSFDGFRTIEECVEGGTIQLQTSTFADFKSLLLDENKGDIQGIFTRDFGDDTNVLVINSLADIMFTETLRCDPDILDCTGPVSTAVTVFEQDFETITNEAQLDALGWTNVNVSGGSERFEDGSFGGDRYMIISAFGTGEDPLEAWLVTPAINLDGTTQEELSFNISANFETGQILQAFISENFTGDVTTTEWTLLDANIPIGPSGFGSFVPSDINISCLNGDVHVAFKYLGAAGGAETRYHIDDIKVTGM